MAESPFNTPRKIALFTASTVSVIMAGMIFLLLVFTNGQFNYWLLLVGPIIGFIATYFLLRYAVERFIHDKIKIIYKTIHSNKTSVSTKELDFKEDVLDTVNREVLSWAEDSSKEIDELKRREEYRREFLGDVAHELKTPIFNIQGYVHTLLDGGLEDEDVNRKFLNRADKSVERMISIVKDLEAITKMESGVLELDMEKLNIAELAEGVLDQLESKAEKSQVSIKFDQSYDRQIMVQADRDMIVQVYTNLMDNSINYSGEGSKITLRFFDMDKHILCEVADNGRGIEQEHIPRLFERFYRVDKARTSNKGGTGLGLAIVKHILEAHEQTINVRSSTEERSGTTFSFTLMKA
ncbi:MAG: two-component system phosphate regulon sensor histidine kinase PhoR [Bacteroidia bacterium]|jgi:two-component system phosphate regulon sensor histidine kinase PhoR